MNIFLHVAESLSFTQAARQLGVSASAVGKSISRLEAQLGVQLLYRSTRSMTLTEEGRYFLTRSRNILDDVASLQHELTAHQHRPKGHLRLSLPNARALMLPILSDFTRLYPEITLDLDFNDRVVDLIDEKFDAVVRAACLPDFAIHDALVAGKLERVLPDQTGRSGTFHMLWPSNRYLTSRLRVLIDHFSARLSAPSLSQ